MRKTSLNFRALRNNKTNANNTPPQDTTKEYIKLQYTPSTPQQKTPDSNVVNDIKKKLFDLVAIDCESALRFFPKEVQESREYFNNEEVLENTENDCEGSNEDLEDEEHPQIIYLDSDIESETHSVETDDGE